MADQLAKLAVGRWFELGARIPVIAGFFDLVHFRNTGAAFGMFSDLSDSLRIPLFYAVTAVAVVFVGVFYRSLGPGERLLQITLSLIFGGIAGNILDRIRLGAVTDFLSFRIGDYVLEGVVFGRHYSVPLEWPAFNVADSAITVAMFLLLYSVFRKHREV